MPSEVPERDRAVYNEFGITRNEIQRAGKSYFGLRGISATHRHGTGGVVKLGMIGMFSQRLP